MHFLVGVKVRVERTSGALKLGTPRIRYRNFLQEGQSRQNADSLLDIQLMTRLLMVSNMTGPLALSVLIPICGRWAKTSKNMAANNRNN